MIFEEYFDGGIPSAWANIDQDGDTYNWYSETWNNPNGSEEKYVVSASYDYANKVPLTPENYLITPQINLTGLTGSVQLRYTIQIDDPDFAEEHYKVAVSTTGKAVADFTNVVKDEICTAADYYKEFPYWHERIVDLTPFIGQNIYLTLVHFDCTDMSLLYLDSLQVSNSPDVNLTNREQSSVSIYPNPAKGKIQVNGSFENAQVQLFTADGRMVYKSVKESRQANINVSGLESGVYILKINSQKGTLTKKVNISN